MTLNVTLFGDNPQQPSIAAEAYVPDQLIAGTLHLVTQQVIIAGSQGVLPRGQVLALNTSTGKYVISTSGGANGVGTPSAILVDQLDTTAGDVSACDVYTLGEFNSAALTFDSSFSTIANLVKAIGTGTIYIKTTSAGLTQVPES